MSGPPWCELHHLGHVQPKHARTDPGALSVTNNATGVLTTRPNDYQALAIWDTAQSCSNGTCTTSTFTPPPIHVTQRDLAGNNTRINPGASIQIGAKPVLLENR